MMKGVKLVITKEHVCKEKVVFAEIEDATSRMADQAKTRETAGPILSAKVIAQEIMASAQQEFSVMIWTFWMIIIWKQIVIILNVYMYVYVQMICLLLYLDNE